MPDETNAPPSTHEELAKIAEAEKSAGVVDQQAAVEDDETEKK